MQVHPSSETAVLVDVSGGSAFGADPLYVARITGRVSSSRIQLGDPL